MNKDGELKGCVLLCLHPLSANDTKKNTSLYFARFYYNKV